jgi:excisionase family DNA binding protein
MGTKRQLTIPEVARRFKVSRITVWNWVKKGLLTAEQVSPKLWLIQESSLKHFIPPYQLTGIGRPPGQG